MKRRFVTIWFQHLITDWMTRKHPELKQLPFVMAAPERGRRIVKAVNRIAQSQGIEEGMLVADCRAILPSLQVYDAVEGTNERLLNALAEWCIRYTPVVAPDLPDGLILDVSGCPHLWGSEQAYIKDIYTKLTHYGYHIRIGMADTIGAAWAVSHYGNAPIVETCMQVKGLSSLPPAALRLDSTITERLHKLGLKQISSLYQMPRNALKRRFGDMLLTRLDQALGQEAEFITSIQPVEPYQERLPCLEPIRTAKAIEIAIRKILERLCTKLGKKGKGLRKALLTAYRIDGNIQQIEIGTNKASRHVAHLFKLFELKIASIEPDLGIELFMMEAWDVEDMVTEQEAIWHEKERDNTAIAELLDRIAGKVGKEAIRKYLPDEHYMPERALKLAVAYDEQPATTWRTDTPRPIHLLAKPEPIEVTVPIPDYPPMLFIYKNRLHNIRKADGPERIEQEWWLEKGLFRDYYCVEDEAGCRYWLFRSGHYKDGDPKWFIHGFFA